MKCESCGKTKRVFELKGNATWYQCWSCLELRAQEELKVDGIWATDKKVWARRQADIKTFKGHEVLGTS